MADGEWRRTVQCEGAGGLIREFIVTIPGGARVSIQAPPGEYGVLTLQGCARLRQAIEDAELEAATRGLSES